MSARGRPDAVADVSGLCHQFVVLVPQRDPAHDLVILNDPPISTATALVGKPFQQGAEPGRRVDLIASQQSEPILVESLPHSACARSQAVCRRSVGAIKSGMAQLYRTAAMVLRGRFQGGPA